MQISETVSYTHLDVYKRQTGVIPYGAQMLVAISAVNELGSQISAFQVMPRLYYPMFLLISSLIAIVGVKGCRRRYRKIR